MFRIVGFEEFDNSKLWPTIDDIIKIIIYNVLEFTDIKIKIIKFPNSIFSLTNINSIHLFIYHSS